MSRRATAPLRVLQVGGGFWGAGWARAIAASPDAELAGLVDVDAAACARIADQVGLPPAGRHTDLDAALKQAAADAALVVVPPDAHASVSLRCLDHGLDLLVEKPFAPTFAEAAEIVSRARSLGRTVMVTQSFRFKRGPQTVRRAIESGLVGTVEQVDGRFSKAPRHGGFREQMHEPFLTDMAIQHLDFLRGIFGLEPVRVRARSFNPSWSWYRGNAAATVQVETAAGARVSYSGSWVSRSRETTWDGSWEIQGTEGSIVWERNRVEYRPVDFGRTVFQAGALERGDGVMELPLVTMEAEERAGTLAEFAAAVRTDREPESSGADNLGTLALVFGAISSAEADTWVDVVIDQPRPESHVGMEKP